MSATSKLIYTIAFQVGWFICILAGNWVSFIYAAIFLTIHLWFLAHHIQPPLMRTEVLWISIVFSGGLIIETVFFSAGFLSSQAPLKLFEHLILPPLWLLNLWVIFAIALRTCLSFIFYKPKVTYLLSCLCTPLNYYAGAKLNSDVVINSPFPLSLALITLLWIALLWFLINLRHHYFEDMFNAG